MFARHGERIPPCGVPVLLPLTAPSSVRIPAIRNALTKRQHALVPNATPDPVQKGRVRDLIETGGDVAFQNPLV